MNIDAKDIPEGATDYAMIHGRHVFFRRFKALGMNLLEEWQDERWQVCSYLPWDDLEPIP